jgi:hypothetical protein
MGTKRLKLAKGLGDFVPVAANFTELKKEYDENNEEFDPGDDNQQVAETYDNLIYDELVVQMLCNLESREKLVFLYQLLRDGGFQIDHAAFAKTIDLSRRQYMRVLESVRLKTQLMVFGYKRHKEFK